MEPTFLQDDQQETLVNEAIRKFCHYLNLWWNADTMNWAEKDPYTPEKFLITHPEEDLYGETDWEVLKDLEGPGKNNPAFQEGLIRVVTTDGDEGGGSTLWVGLEGNNLGNDFDCQISWIAHTFDLTTYMIYTKEDGFRSPNQPKE